MSCKRYCPPGNSMPCSLSRGLRQTVQPSHTRTNAHTDRPTKLTPLYISNKPTIVLSVKYLTKEENIQSNDLNKTNTLRLLINIGPNGSTTLIGSFLPRPALALAVSSHSPLQIGMCFSLSPHPGGRLRRTLRPAHTHRHTQYTLSCMDRFVFTGSPRPAAGGRRSGRRQYCPRRRLAANTVPATGPAAAPRRRTGPAPGARRRRRDAMA